MVCRNPGVFRPFFIAAGLFTRPVAFLLSGQMAFAYFLSHFPRDSGPSSTEVRGRPSSASSFSCWWRRAPAAWPWTTFSSEKARRMLNRAWEGV